MKLATETFAGIVDQVKEWMSLEDIVALCDHDAIWPDGFEDDAIEHKKKIIVRNLCRRVKWTDEEGHEIELVNILQADALSGKPKRVYKQLALFDVPDFVQVVKDRMDRSGYFYGEAKRFARLAAEKFGKRIYSLLPLDFGDEDTAEDLHVD